MDSTIQDVAKVVESSKASLDYQRKRHIESIKETAAFITSKGDNIRADELLAYIGELQRRAIDINFIDGMKLAYAGIDHHLQPVKQS